MTRLISISLNGSRFQRQPTQEAKMLGWSYRRFSALTRSRLVLGILFTAVLSALPTSSRAATAGADIDPDFATRCAAPGVLRCFSFDTDADFDFGVGGFQGARGKNFGYMPAGGSQDYTRITRDTSTKASGNSSLRFNIPGSGGSDVVGQWFTNFSSDLLQQLNPGQDVWIQVRYRVDSNFYNQVYTGSGGFKILDISGGDLPTCNPNAPDSTNCPTTCWDGENVFTTTKKTLGHMLVGYSNCGGQNAFSNWSAMTSNVTDQNVVNCLYPNYPSPPCIYLTPNEWWTLKIHIHLGTYNSWSSTVQAWVGREGQPTTLIIDCGPSPGRVCNDRGNTPQPTGWYIAKDPATNVVVGKVWLIPYQTGANYSGLQPASVWYDNLIISRQDIADPGAGASSPSPNAPSNLLVR